RLVGEDVRGVRDGNLLRHRLRESGQLVLGLMVVGEPGPWFPVGGAVALGCHASLPSPRVRLIGERRRKMRNVKKSDSRSLTAYTGPVKQDLYGDEINF